MVFGATENPLIKRYYSEVRDSYKSCIKKDVTIKKSLAINYCHLHKEQRSKRLTIVLPGNKEPLIVYMNLGLDILKTGTDDVLLIDQIGQGESSRPLANRSKIYIEDFDNYIRAAQNVLDRVESIHKYESLRVIGHSMGSLVAFEFTKKNLSRVNSVILSSPMFRFNAFGLPDFFVKNVVSLIVGMGFSETYAFGQGPYKDKKFYPDNPSTTNKTWYEYSRFLYKKHPYLKSHGNTFAWVDSSYKKLEELEKGIDSLKMPIHMFQASDDVIVDIAVIERVCKKIKTCKLHYLKGAKHDLFRELDIHQKVLNEAIF
jgi:lysophospholipase